MHIKSITIRNYRVHRELSVPLDDFRTLIGGPNECGKSTLVEAVHRALFLKSKITGDVQKSMVSNCFPGAPEVELAFSVGGSNYELSKRFSGNNGTTRLVQHGKEPWFGEDAETRLAALLKVEALGGGRGVGERIVQQWSHLWVWQGESGNDPSQHANLQKDDLLHQLQRIGGAAALQSELDARVAARFAAAEGGFFTQAGDARANSELDKAEKAASQAETERLKAAQRVTQLQEAAVDFESATNAIAVSVQDLTRLKGQKEGVAAKLASVADLRQLEACQTPNAASTQATYEELKRKDTQIAELRARIRILETSLQPQNEKTKTLEEALLNARQHSNEAAQRYEQSANGTRTARQRRDLAAAWVARLEKEGRLKELSNKENQVREHQQQLNQLREELAKLPEVTAAKLRRLRNLEAEVSECEATLRGMAVGIEVLAAGEPVRVGESSLGVGESQVVTEPAEITVGKSVRLRISPGGGIRLQEARTKVQESRQQLREQLDALMVNNVAEATDALTRRSGLSGRIDNIETALTALDAAGLPNTMASANEAVAAAVAQVENRTAQVPGFTAPPALADARQCLVNEEEGLSTAESEESQARVLSTAATNSFGAADEALSNHRHAIANQTNELTGVRAQVNLLLETQGNDEARAMALNDSLLAKNLAKATLSGTRNALAELQPEILEQDRNRLERAWTKAEQAKHDAETKRAVAQAALRSDGMDDPEAGLAQAIAQARSTQDHLASVRRKAEGMRMLNQLFLDEQRSLAEQFTKPFAERISGYIQCLFGAGAQATVILAENTFQGLQLVRPIQGGGAVAFDHLSGGTREQVAAAVRLAMAEVLAEDHDGCLPVVFDDAFAYSDPDRVQILQRMLDLAVSRGLQLIILTCNPSDYAALGASQVILQPARLTSVTQALAIPTVPNGGKGESEDVPPSQVETPPGVVQVSAEQSDQLLNRLQEMGGKAGNLALREALGWDEPTYNGVKNNLIASGRLVSGRGRGGSVALRGKEYIR